MSKVNLDAIRKILVALEDETDRLHVAEMEDSQVAALSFEDDLLIDSLEFVVFQMELERACEVSLSNIPDKELRQVKTIQDFLSLCEKYL